MSPFEAEFGADLYEARLNCRGTGVIVYRDGEEKCPGCDDCDPEIVDEADQRRRENNEAIYLQYIRNFFLRGVA